MTINISQVLPQNGWMARRGNHEIIIHLQGSCLLGVIDDGMCESEDWILFLHRFKTTEEALKWFLDGKKYPINEELVYEGSISKFNFYGIQK